MIKALLTTLHSQYILFTYFKLTYSLTYLFTY